MSKLTIQSANKFQAIMTKRLGRSLSDDELQETYDNLMDFAYALVNMVPTTIGTANTTTPSLSNKQFGLANYTSGTVPC